MSKCLCHISLISFLNGFRGGDLGAFTWRDSYFSLASPKLVGRVLKQTFATKKIGLLMSSIKMQAKQHV